MSTDPNEHRRESRANWEEAAAGWVRRQDLVREFARPLSQWMIEAISPQPGQRVLELAAGLGETGLLAAELVAPMGGVVISDQAEAMLSGARARAAELGLMNVEFKVLDAEWIDLPLASVDAVLCRWGYMLMADPGTALAETRRVLRPGGRLALAVWDALEHNPWAALPAQVLGEHGRAPGAGGPASQASDEHSPRGQAPQSGVPEPGPFALADRARLQALLAEAGFAAIEIDVLELPRRHAGFEEFFQTTLDLSRRFHDAILERPESEIAEIRATLEERIAPYASPDGSIELPARTLVASAEA